MGHLQMQNDQDDPVPQLIPIEPEEPPEEPIEVVINANVPAHDPPLSAQNDQAEEVIVMDDLTVGSKDEQL